MAKRVVVVPYNEQWKTDFDKIKQHLLPAIKDTIISIEHIGSTSVEGLSAKPIIDIDIVIKDYSVFDTVVLSTELFEATILFLSSFESNNCFLYIPYWL